MFLLYDKQRLLSLFTSICNEHMAALPKKKEKSAIALIKVKKS